MLAKIKRQAVLHEVNAIIGIKYDIFSIAANMIAVSIVVQVLILNKNIVDFNNVSIPKQLIYLQKNINSNPHP